MRLLFAMAAAVASLATTAAAQQPSAATLLRPAQVFDGVDPHPHAGWSVLVDGGADASNSLLYFQKSIEFLIAVVIGGAATLSGPLLGPIEGGALGIGVDNDDALSVAGPLTGEMQGERRLADATFLIEERDDHDVIPSLR